MSRPNTVGWGFNFIIENELDAYKKAYHYRFHKGEVRVEKTQDGKYLVTVFKEDWNPNQFD